MVMLQLLRVLCVCSVVSCYEYYRNEGGHVRRHTAGLHGELGTDGAVPPESPASAEESDCPAQCRCIALTHLGYRDMAERWRSLGEMEGLEHTFKGTVAPTWQKDPAELQGRDIVCMGLNKVPRPLPKIAPDQTTRMRHDLMACAMRSDCVNDACLIRSDCANAACAMRSDCANAACAMRPDCTYEFTLRHEIRLRECGMRHEIRLHECGMRHEIRLRECTLRHEIRVRECGMRHEIRL
ncbi:hypothetical protein DPMN_187241 [Dreissena polymorpha]|uniref:Uncharacterized protein n=1 Tax=Dreissena polymorpha TaxID=45954 RepID=A0A9D4I8V7_DREPO|nr:hypothetical protein DPMN_187241 [Dreissena polymorpha]